MTLPLSGNALSLEVLLEPIDPGQACGPSLRYDPDYDRLRELRREDDSSLPTGVWQAEAKRADWPRWSSWPANCCSGAART